MPAIINNCSILTQIIDPYTIGDVIVAKRQDGYGYKVYDSNILVFYLNGHHIEENTYGDWAGKLAREVKRIQSVRGILDT